MTKFAMCLRGGQGKAAARWVERSLDAGFESLGIEHPFHAVDWEAVRTMLPGKSVSSVQLFLPYPRDVKVGERCPFKLASFHPEEKRDAARQGTQTIVFARRNSVPVVLVPPAPLEDAPHEDLSRLPREKVPGAALETFRAQRRKAADRALDSLRSLLWKLLAAADRYDVRLSLTPAGRLDEIPDLEEAAGLLREFEGGPVSLWFDTWRHAPRDEEGAEAVQAWSSSWQSLTHALLGATLRDKGTRGNHEIVGRGATSWESLRPLLEKSPVWLADLPSAAEPETFAEVLAFLEKLSRGPEPKREPRIRFDF